MKRLMLLGACLVGLAGCGPDHRDAAQSQVNLLAESWDGSGEFAVNAADPWGEAISAKVEKGDVFFHLTVRSNGPDRLPLTNDDIVAKRSVKHTPISDALAPAADKLGEAIGKGLGRGGIAGIKEGITGKKEPAKKDQDRP